MKIASRTVTPISVLSRTLMETQMQKQLILGFVFSFGICTTYTQLFGFHLWWAYPHCMYFDFNRKSPVSFTTAEAARMVTDAPTSMSASMPWKETAGTGRNVSWTMAELGKHHLLLATGQEMARRNKVGLNIINFCNFFLSCSESSLFVLCNRSIHTFVSIQRQICHIFYLFILVYYDLFFLFSTKAHWRQTLPVAAEWRTGLEGHWERSCYRGPVFTAPHQKH